MAQRRPSNLDIFSENPFDKLRKMQSDKRTLHRRRYLIKKNGSIGRIRNLLDLSHYQFMLDNQKGLCAICDKKCSSGRALAIDHNHVTGEVRGLLCGKCNRGLGLFCDNAELLIKAGKYLKKYGAK